jgi:hypothetical protein
VSQSQIFRDPKDVAKGRSECGRCPGVEIPKDLPVQSPRWRLRANPIDVSQQRLQRSEVNGGIDPVQLDADLAGVIHKFGNMIELVGCDAQLQERNWQYRDPRNPCAQE